MCISQTYDPRLSVGAIAASTSHKDRYADVQKPSMMGALFLAQRKQDQKYLRPHHLVLHDYHDHFKDVDDGSLEPVARGGVATPFPIKLHEILGQIEHDGYGHVVSWQPHGRCFVVHKPKEFVKHIMPTYMKQSKFPSFQRQLNLYGFQRITKGPDKGGYYHELFLKSKLFLAYRIQRTRVKGTGVRARSNPGTEPNFSKMAPVVPNLNAENDALPFETPSSPLLDHDEIPSAVDPFDKDLGDFEGMNFYLLEVESFYDELNISRYLYQEIASSVDDDQSFGGLLQHIIE